MFDHALANNKIIGMIQPKGRGLSDSDTKNQTYMKLVVQAGITAFSETNDNRYELILKGVCRFRMKKRKK